MIVICVISILYFIRKKKVFSTQYSGADELKKYKELLDLGAITQEEFNLKKSQIFKKM